MVKEMFDKLIANTDYAAQQNCKLSLEQITWSDIVCLLKTSSLGFTIYWHCSTRVCIRL